MSMEHQLVAGTRGYRLGSTPAREVRVSHRFTNRQRGTTQLWVAIPPNLAGTQVVHDVQVEPGNAVRYRGPDQLGLNELAHLELEPGQTATLRAEVATFERSLDRGGTAPDLSPHRLADAEREAFLRSTPLIPVTAERRDRAAAIRDAAGAQHPLDVARALYDELVSSAYSYRYPPKDRGADQMELNRRGDCGEFSFLYAAWCRSLGIPCRVMFGSFAKGFMRGHAWNEFHLPDVGWVPVDASMGWVARRRPWKPSALGLPMNQAAYFGRLDGARVVFSLDADLPVVPMVPEPTFDAPSKSLRISGAQHRWGVDHRDGLVPYLQPVYPGFSAPARRGQPLLGPWRVQESGARGWLDRAAAVGLVLVALAFVADLLQSVVGFDGAAHQVMRAVGAVGFGAWSIALVLRREMRLLILPIWALLGLALVAAIVSG